MLIKLFKRFKCGFFPSWIKNKKEQKIARTRWCISSFLFLLSLAGCTRPPCFLLVIPYSSYAWWALGLVFPNILLLKCSNIQKSWKNFTVETNILFLPSTFYYIILTVHPSVHLFLCILKWVSDLGALSVEPSLLLKVVLYLIAQLKNTVSKYCE